VQYGGVTVVKEGAKGSARVKSVEPAGRAGKPGRVEIEFLELQPNGAFQTEGDKPIMLKNLEPVVANGKGRKTLSYLFIFGLFIKGSEGVIRADVPFKAETTEDVVVLVE